MYDSFNSDKEDDIYINVKDVRNPNEFIACLGTISDFSKYDFFIEKINNWCKQNKLKTPHDKNDLYVEQLVLVEYKLDKLDDILWKRGKIIELKDTSCEVLLIDEGIFMNASFDIININIPDFINELAGQAKMCSLNKAIPISSTWTDEGIKFFKDLINDSGLVVTYVTKTTIENAIKAFNQHYIIDVFYKKDGRQILDILVNENHAKELGFTNYRDSSQINHENIEEIQLSSDEEIDEILFVENIKIKKSSSKFSMSKSNNNFKLYKTENDDNNNDIIECDIIDDEKHSRFSQSLKSNKKVFNQKTNYTTTRNSNCDNRGYFYDNSGLDDYIGENSNIALLLNSHFHCSDDTVVTGYKPNVAVDTNKIANLIKTTNIKILNQTVYGNKKPFISKLNSNDDINLKKIEKRVFEVTSGTSGLYNNLDKKYNALAKIYIEEPRINLIIILKCILKEIKNNKTKMEDGFDLMQRLKFCTESYFSQAFADIITENEPNEIDQDLVAIGDSKRKDFCYFLANVYKLALSTDKYTFLKSIPSKCDDLIKSWITCQSNLDILCSIRHAKLKCVHDFLKKCLEEFKSNHFDTFDLVLEKTLDNAKDFTILSREIVTVSNSIIELYARAYRNLRVTQPKSSSDIDNFIRSDDNNTEYICFSRKRKPTGPSFIDSLKNQNDDDDDFF